MTLDEISEEFADELDEQPWLRPFVESGDEDLTMAQRRFDETVVEAMAHLRSRGVEVRSLVVTAGGLQTTMLAVKSEISS